MRTGIECAIFLYILLNILQITHWSKGTFVTLNESSFLNLCFGPQHQNLPGGCHFLWHGLKQLLLERTLYVCIHVCPTIKLFLLK